MTPSPEPASELRGAFRSAAKAGDTHRAIRAARELLHPGHHLSFLVREIAKAAEWDPPLTPIKVALLSSFSIEFAEPALVAQGFLNGLAVKIYRPGFSQFRQQILDSTSGLYAFEPNVVILAVEGSDWAPTLYRGFSDGSEVQMEACVGQVLEEGRALLTTLRRHSGATVLVHNFALPQWLELGILDGHVDRGQAGWVRQVNDGLAAVCRETTGVYVVDYAGLVARVGATSWYDERMRLYARAPIAAGRLGQLAGEHMKYCRALLGLSKKCVVVDLDNTLWGGVLGEDGPHGIRLGSEYPGNAYVTFQQELLNLTRRGVILAIASKNNPADVDEVFARNRNMVLKREHFSSLQIHWGPKSESVRAIARQLNIGLEHMVFVDDNPVECEEVASALPMVRTICLPRQPEAYVTALLEEGLFDTLALSAEDLRRGDLYRQRDQAEALRAASGSLEEFYRSLKMEVTIAPVTMASLARAAQLTQKTNQFNVTTLRYAEADLRTRMRAPEWVLATVGVRDRFGDNGIVGVLMASPNDGALEIDTLLLSCRVIGRCVETAMLAFLCGEAARRGLREVRGRIVPTSKNPPVRDLFAQHGFERVAERDSGETSWSLPLARGGVMWPAWMKVTVVDETAPVA
ncbi:MAG TPA: HAD-IIIC family phosphatase [Gemmatimonadales bacterium]|nr:HAD-IIIC family phosphatase [Gemmatimonadales bacterium]